MATTISAGDIGGAYLQSAGWKLIEHLANANELYGFYTKGGTAFYFDPTGELSNGNDRKAVNPTTTIGDKVINAVSGVLDTLEKSFIQKVTVQTGVNDITVNTNSEITNAPIEKGEFLSVNKTDASDQFTVNYIVTGTVKQRQYILDACKKAKKSRTLFILYAGEISHQNVNITGCSIHRDPKNIQLFNILIQAKEVRNTAKSSSPLANATAYHGTSKNLGELQTQQATGVQEQMARKRQ